MSDRWLEIGGLSAEDYHREFARMASASPNLPCRACGVKRKHHGEDGRTRHWFVLPFEPRINPADMARSARRPHDGAEAVSNAVPHTTHSEDRRMAKGEWQTLNPPERARTYHYAGGESRRFENVTRVKVSESGNHYLETAQGEKAIIAPQWRAIDLDVDAWTF
jgi:hypothetical protein